MSWTIPAEKAEKINDFLDRRGTTYLEYGGGNRDFAAYLALCDRICSRLIGVGIFDIADWNWHDAFDGEQSPREAVTEALSEDDTFGEMFQGQ